MSRFYYFYYQVARIFKVNQSGDSKFLASSVLSGVYYPTRSILGHAVLDADAKLI